jgi:hypothetical protein
MTLTIVAAIHLNYDNFARILSEGISIHLNYDKSRSLL